LQGRLFESFQQADNSISRSHGGTGLGLAITRSLAMMMGGEAGFRSCPGEGSLFWFEIPLDIVDSALSIGPLIDVAGSVQEVERILNERHRKARLLLVEDDLINRETVLWMLTEVGMTADIAFNGRDAVKIVQEKRFDLILMDMQMPEMDGLEATRSIRQIPERGAVPIVALTANAFEQDQRACRDAGMNDFLSKPMMPEDLYAMLLKWLGDSTAAPSDEA